MNSLQILDKDNWENFYTEGVHVLVVGKTTCNACKEWGTELESYLDSSDDFPSVEFGKIMIDQGGLVKWKKASPWLADVSDLPCTVILKNGEIMKQFYGKGIERLKNRLTNVLEETNSDETSGGCGCGCHS